VTERIASIDSSTGFRHGWSWCRRSSAGAAHCGGSQIHPSVRGWGQHIEEALGPIGAQVLRDLRSGTFLIRGLLTYADIDTDAGFADRVETSLSRPTREWADPLLERSRGIPPARTRGRPPDALSALSGAARMFHDAAVGPYWDRMCSAVVTSALAWMHTMSTEGLEALLNSLHPTSAGCDQSCRSFRTGATALAAARTEHLSTRRHRADGGEPPGPRQDNPTNRGLSCFPRRRQRPHPVSKRPRSATLEARAWYANHRELFDEVASAERAGRSSPWSNLPAKPFSGGVRMRTVGCKTWSRLDPKCGGPA